MKQSVLLKNSEYHKIHSYLRSLFSQTFHILWLPALVLFVNIVFEAGGIYYALPLIDMPMHFAGGASIAVAGIAFLAFLRTRGFVSELPFLVRTLVVEIKSQQFNRF